MDKNVIKNLLDWTKKYVTESAKADGIVIGMSGGKDSTIVAKVCAEALGKENVFGVIMPNGKMSDIDDAKRACEVIGIRYCTVNIEDTYKSIINNVENNLPNKKLTDVSTINTPPRIRMTTLYAFAGSMNYIVANTSNLSECMVGYTTKWGDNVGDFAPLLGFTKTEVCELGLMLGLPDDLVNKIPSDGLSGKSDEEKLGYSYKELDELIREGKKGANYNKILRAHKITKHKRDPIAKFESNLKNYLD